MVYIPICDQALLYCFHHIIFFHDIILLYSGPSKDCGFQKVTSPTHNFHKKLLVCLNKYDYLSKKVTSLPT